MMDKKEATKYILLQLCNWYYDINSSKEESGANDLSILKSLKLIFFLSTIEIDKKSLITYGIDDYYALPYGHVELEIYNSFRNELNYLIDNNQSNFNEIKKEIINLSSDNREFINNIFYQLKKKNSNLIKYSASELVELSHKHFSWIKFFNEAKIQGRLKQKINIEVIKAEEKFYFL